MATPIYGTVAVPAITPYTFVQRASRNSLLIQNNGATWLKLGFDANLSAVNGLDLAPKTATSAGGYWACDDMTVPVLVLSIGLPGSINFIETVNE